MRKLTLILMISLSVTGCAVRKDFYASGGSRSDGSIDMAYNFRQFEQPVVNYDQAKNIARDKCKVWGYQDAEMFGGATQNCQQFNGYGNCVAGQMVVKYQCIGNLDAPGVHAAAPQGMLTPEQYKAARVKALMDKNLPYEDYQRQYNAIMAQ